MTDEEALANLPAVMEFRDAVKARDVLVVEACLVHTDPRLLAAWCAEMWCEAESDVEGLRDELLLERRLLAETRTALGQALQVGGPVTERLSAENLRLRDKVRELRELLDAKAEAAPKRRKDAA